MEIYTVSFFGHRLVERASEIQVRLEILLHDLITQKEYVEFLIGRDGEFDLLAASSIRRAVKQYGYGNTSIILVLPYIKAEYRDNKQYYLSYYDEVEICSESSDAHYKSAGKLGHGIGYEYAHDYPNHFSHQRYLPEGLERGDFYRPGNLGYEQVINEYLDKVRNNK